MHKAGPEPEIEARGGQDSRRQNPSGVSRLGRLVAASPAMRQVLSRMAALAGSDLPILIEGGPGTGKSLAASTLCELSYWARFPRLEVDLSESGVPVEEGLAEIRSLARRGYGTLIFESVETLSSERQKLLVHLLDEILPVEHGGKLRLISTSRRELRAEVARGRFRADLYYRLRGALLRMPSFAERPEDLPLVLADAMQGSPFESFDGARRASDAGVAEPPRNLREYRRKQERALVLEALEGVRWNVSAAARGLGLSRVGLSKKMKVLGLVRPTA